jgi:hypothetical protein
MVVGEPFSPPGVKMAAKIAARHFVSTLLQVPSARVGEAKEATLQRLLSFLLQMKAMQNAMNKRGHDHGRYADKS